VNCCQPFAIAIPLAVALLARGASPCQAQSPMFRGDPLHSGVSMQPVLSHFGGVAWWAPTDGPVRASPTIRGAVVYIGSSDGSVYAFALADGSVHWRARVGAPVSSTVALTGALAIVQSDDGSVHALSLADGSERWVHRGGAAAPLAWGFENGDYFTSSPVALGEDAVIVGGRDGRLVALDAATGRERWRYDAGAQIWGSLAVGDGTVVVGDQRGRVHAVDAGTGRPLWRFRAAADSLRSSNFGYDRQTIQSSPAVAGQTVLLGARDGFLYAINLRTGRERWRFDHQVSWVNASPAISDGVVYAASSDAGFADALDLATGRELWRTTGLGVSWSSPLVAGEFLYVATSRGWLYALDRKTGARRWAYRADGAIWSSPILADGLLVFGNDDGGVYALRGGSQELRRVAFWDSTLTASNGFGGDEELRDYLASRGWTIMDTDSLVPFLEGRIVDRAPSVVTFTLDQLPPRIAGIPSDTVLLRRYLDAGGKVVWPGVPPLLWPRDTSGPELARIDRAACMAVLAIDCAPGNFNDWRAEATEAGHRWGLYGWWIARWSVNAASVSTVLAGDQRGDASSFVKTYGGAPGSGFVRIGGGDLNAVFRTRRRIDPETIRRAAEHFPLSTPPR